jgi:hypothetical protein
MAIQGSNRFARGRKAARLVLVMALVTTGGVAGAESPREGPAAPRPAVVAGAPPSSGNVDGSIPPLPGDVLALPEAAADAAGPSSAHEGMASWYTDLVSSQGWPTEGPWKTSFSPSASAALAHTAAPAIAPRVDEALTSAAEHRDALDAATLGEAFSLFDKIDSTIPGAEVEIAVPTRSQESFFGYRPQRGRWLRSRLRQAGTPPFEPDLRYAYADFGAFGDVRLRGARLYCAARRAQLEADGKTLSLGERTGFSFDLLGRTIDLMVVEPTVALNGPRAFLGPPGTPAPADGAQAFDIPFLLGTRVTPIRGIGLPGFGEVRVPVNLVSADTEVRTFAEKAKVPTGGGASSCADCPPGWVVRHTKEYQTVTHVDALMGAGFADPDDPFRAKARFTLFYVGPVRVFADLTLLYEVGRFEVGNDRILDGVAPATRTGMLLVNPPDGVRYHDGPWRYALSPGFPQWQTLPEGAAGGLWTRPVSWSDLRTHDLRAGANDDHSLDSSTGLALSMGLGGELGGKKGPLEAAVEARGAMTGAVSQHTLLRDALLAQVPIPEVPHVRPVDAVTVRPRQTAKVTFDGIDVTFRFRLNLGPLGKVNVKRTLLRVPGATLADYDSDRALASADEAFRLRLGTGSSAGKPMTQPAVLSHLPQGPTYDTFEQDVATCLADTTPLPPPPPPCAPAVDDGAPPRAEMCLYGPSAAFQKERLKASLPPGVCAKRSAWTRGLSLTRVQRQCVSQYLGLLCASPSKQQTWDGASVVSHVWDGTTEGALDVVVRQCASAFLTTSDSASAKTSFAEGLVSVAACRGDAGLLAGSDVFRPRNPGLPPTPHTGEACRN